MMDRAISSLLLKSNRSLASSLLRAGLVSQAAVEEANQLLMERLHGGSILKANLLHILLFERQDMAEGSMLAHLQREHRLGLLPMRCLKLDAELMTNRFSPLEQQATTTLVLSEQGGTLFLATAYYLSAVVRQHWAERVAGRIVWYAAPLADLHALFEQHLPPTTTD
jgi:hypothetical protein